MTNLIRLLVVEDNPPWATKLAQLLRDRFPDAEIITVSDEPEAVKACEKEGEEPFLLAVVDLQLYRGTGFGVIRELRETSRGTHIIVHTNHVVPALRLASNEAGADSFIDKMKPEQLAQALDAAQVIIGKAAIA